MVVPCRWERPGCWPGNPPRKREQTSSPRRTTTPTVPRQNVYGNVYGGWDTVISTQELREELRK
ncbi:MAG: hypothetical protein JWQ08_1534 [Deinococcus sp.]|nr:hypothetical protein [Deinococcus sp.]